MTRSGARHPGSCGGGDDNGGRCDDESYGWSLNDLVCEDLSWVGDAGCTKVGAARGVVRESGDNGMPDKGDKDEGEENAERMLQS